MPGKGEVTRRATPGTSAQEAKLGLQAYAKLTLDFVLHVLDDRLDISGRGTTVVDDEARMLGRDARAPDYGDRKSVV